MANEEQLAILKQGRTVWNQWRQENRDSKVDLTGADLREAYLVGSDLSEVDLSGANLSDIILSATNLHSAILRRINLSGAKLEEAFLNEADLSEADLRRSNLSRASMLVTNLSRANLSEATLYEASLDGANLHEAILEKANLEKASLSDADLSLAKLHRAKLSAADLWPADLRGADLSNVDLSGANLTGANLHGANLYEANLILANLHMANLSETDLRNSDLTACILVETDLSNARLSGCRVFGISAWKLRLDRAEQLNLIITEEDEPIITVDNLEIAQFIYLLLHNEKLRDVIETIGKKAVLILGRFTEERKAVLDAIREELRYRDYVPILFDFDKPANRDLTETVVLLAGMARFVIVDLSDPNSSPHEVMAFAEKLPSVPVQAIFCPVPEHKNPYPMYEHFERYRHVLPIFRYDNQDMLMASLSEKVIAPAEAKVQEMKPKPPW